MVCTPATTVGGGAAAAVDAASVRTAAMTAAGSPELVAVVSDALSADAFTAKLDGGGFTCMQRATNPRSCAVSLLCSWAWLSGRWQRAVHERDGHMLASGRMPCMPAKDMLTGPLSCAGAKRTLSIQVHAARTCPPSEAFAMKCLRMAVMRQR